MRIVFMGTPDFAVPTLGALVEAGHDLVAAYTQPPRRAGRGKKLQPSAVQIAAEEQGIEVRSPASLKDVGAQADFAALDADVAVVAAYGLILPRAVLDAPKHGCLNVHASLLPKWRGAAPIQRSILAGDSATGVTIMQMEAGLDTGPMLRVVRTDVDGKTAGELTAELAELGAAAMVETLADLPSHDARPQNDAAATHAPKIDKAEAAIDWAKPAGQIERQVRAFAPFPGAWFALDGDRVKVLAAQVVAREGKPGTVLDDAFTIACGYAALRPTRLQRAGKPTMNAEDFLRGKPVASGTQL
ncbi:Methionyl-tRNA formyltransferase [Alteripontixanthobacter maritimus]|uniref:Methionyl-tRNA formyltransferase n=1 Tax=Alteripontixanthobacter maritimus TaxID=2161824 RepID=A0A369QBK0_9SPHN|nr:methionyl-tRNA formyltransferase [Alteripontixanthobacter maritimus]RDC60577.1 Methionyl-tRNA formyltransferase [Alteripontixanthobacter maritimus]